MIAKHNGRPPFRADHIGSLLRPPALRQAFKDHAKHRIDGANFAQIQDRCIREVVKLQQDAGLKVVTDGEFRRGGWSRGFLSAVEGFGFKPSKLTFHNDQGVATAAPAPVAVGKLKQKQSIVADDFDREVAATPADVDVMGHWHQHHSARQYWVNGSLIGYSPLSIAYKTDYEPPSQGFFIVHPTRGKTLECPVYVDE